MIFNEQFLRLFLDFLKVFFSLFEKLIYNYTKYAQPIIFLDLLSNIKIISSIFTDHTCFFSNFSFWMEKLKRSNKKNNLFIAPYENNEISTLQSYWT